LGIDKGKLSTCYHEMGHGFVFTRFGIKVEKIQIGWGIFEDGRTIRSANVKVDLSTKAGRKYWENFIVGLMAGDGFERIYRKEAGFTFTSATGCGDDEKHARRNISIGREAYGLRMSIDDARSEAQRLMRSNRKRVDELVFALYKKGSLKGSALR